ncbi:MAG: hypothetical protein FWF46_09115 [Oscillospiraceae bacterium]|nr:hypothetical protein [Oscillospiraceae bacterium]
MIDNYTEKNNICTLYIGNIRKNNKVINSLNIIDKFVKNTGVYFSIYRVDGMNLSRKEATIYRKVLNNYFENLKEFEIFKRGKQKSLANSILEAIGKLSENNEIYTILPRIFDYYLETSIYKLKHNNFGYFKNIYNEKPMKNLEYYVEKGYSDIAFAHVDSGDFIICFDSNIYEKDSTVEKIRKILTD